MKLKGGEIAALARCHLQNSVNKNDELYLKISTFTYSLLNVTSPLSHFNHFKLPLLSHFFSFSNILQMVSAQAKNLHFSFPFFVCPFFKRIIFQFL